MFRRRKIELMRRLAVLAFACVASAQQAPFTLDQVMGFAFPTSLAAAPTGGKVAWVSMMRGVCNVMVAEPPAYQGRRITRYSIDDGVEIGALGWLPDASAIVYTRGGSANPALDATGPSEAIWVAPLDGTAPRRIGDGSAPAVSPRDGRVAFVLGGQLWLSAAGGKAPVELAFRARGTCVRPVWSERTSAWSDS